MRAGNFHHTVRVPLVAGSLSKGVSAAFLPRLQVLLTSSKPAQAEAKLADFGLAKMLYLVGERGKSLSARM